MVLDVVIPLVAGLVAVIATNVFNAARSRSERKRRRRSLTAALDSEAKSCGVGVWRLLREHPRSENSAYQTDQFYGSASRYAAAGDVFMAHLPSADVIDPGAVRALTDAYVEIRAAAAEADQLADIGSAATPMGMTWALKDRLAVALGQLHRAVSMLGESR